MPGASVSIPRAAWLLVRLRARRTLNRLLAQGWRRKGPPPLGQLPPRAGTPQKRRISWLFALFFGVYMPFLAWKQADQILSVISKRQLGIGMWTRADALPAAVLHDLSIEAAILTLLALVAALANRELSTPEWDLEWLVTLPIPGPALFAIRVLERTLVNPIGFILIGAFTSAIAWRSGFGAAIPLVAAAATAALLLIVAAAWTVGDTALRLAVAPPKLRNIQALLSVAVVLLMIVAVAPVTGVLGPIDYVGAHLPALASWGPAALAVRVLTRTHREDVVAPLARLIFEALAASALAVAALVRIARAGVISGSGRESGRRPRLGARAPVAPVASAAAGFAEEPAGPAEVRARRSPWPTPLQRRDLRLLMRDRSFLVQTLLLPAVIVAAQLYFRTRAIHGAVAVRSNPANVAAAAFGISAYAVMFSALQSLNTEGQALWILYTLPHQLERLLRQKAKLWASISLIYPIAILTASYLHGGLDWRAGALGAIAIAGVPIYAAIATALSVFASDPLAPTTQRRLRLGYTYLYMALAGLFTYALYANDPWQKGVLVVLASLLALALWQKARDQLPYLLDPTAAPGARVSVADGMIAAVLFFVTQGVVAAAIVTAGGDNVGLVVIKAFVWAGAVTFAVMRFAFWRTHAGGVPRLLGVGVPRAIRAGLVGALVASLAGVPYLIILRRFGLLPAIPPEALAAARSWLIPLAVVAAPIFEEFIFRGLIFGGLRRSFGGWSSALASAGIFAIVHPHLSVVPVFVMGVVAARVYDRAGMLLAPMLVHAGYNAAVTWLQPLLAR